MSPQVPLASESSAHPAELPAILHKLTSHIEKTMIALHGLQLATLNANKGTNSTALRNLFGEMRAALYLEWKSVVEFLQKSYAFSQDAIILSASAETDDDTECLDILSCMVPTAAGLHTSCQDLVKSSEEILRRFGLDKDKLDEFIRAGDIPVNLSVHRSVPASHGSADSEIDQYIEANLRIVYPDGSQALSDVDSSLTDARTCLSDMCRFWSSTSDGYSTLNASVTNTPGVSIKLPGLHAEIWSGYQAGIVFSMKSIVKLHDQVLIPPVGVRPGLRSTASTGTVQPPPRRQQRRRSSSKSLPPTPASCSPQSSRQNSWDSDLVPTCWKSMFGAGERKRRLRAPSGLSLN